jgi:hypothetical protein
MVHVTDDDALFHFVRDERFFRYLLFGAQKNGLFTGLHTRPRNKKTPQRNFAREKRK